MDWDFGLIKASFGADKFWRIKYYFDQVPGVIRTTMGYCVDGSSKKNTLEIEYDPDLINYDTLIKHYFRTHDPTKPPHLQTANDSQDFESIILWNNNDQSVMAQIIIDQLQAKYVKKILTKIIQSKNFTEINSDEKAIIEEKNKGSAVNFNYE